MLTIFALPKAFHGHFGMIQRNAILSWTRLRPTPEIILFGDDEGTAEIAKELGLQHVSSIQRNEYGTPLLSDLFKKAHDMAKYNALCYVNADIMLLGEFMRAVEQVVGWRERFLMVGRRTNLDVNQPLDFDLPDWESRIRQLALQQGAVGPSHAIDYFVFHRELAATMQPFAIGRPFWDDWFIWKARTTRSAVVDVSADVLAIHQNHDYSHLPQVGDVSRQKDIMRCEEAERNYVLAGGEHFHDPKHEKQPRGFCTMEDATHKLKGGRLEWNWGQFTAPTQRRIAPWWWAPFRFTARSLGISRAGLHTFLRKARIEKGGELPVQ